MSLGAGKKNSSAGAVFRTLDWAQAQELLLTGDIRGGKQYHTGWLTIYTRDGGKYLTKQPRLDELWLFMKEKKIKLDGFGTE